MKKILRIVALVLLVAGLVFFEIRWLANADYENQKSRTAELITEIAGEVNLIEVGLLEDGEVDDAKTKFDTALLSLQAIPYAVNEKGDLLARLVEFGDRVPNNAELAKELKVLRSLCMGFAEKITNEYKDKTASAELFRTINKEFLDLKDNLPDVQYEFARELVSELKAMVDQVAVSAATTANCVDKCDKATIEAQKTALEKKINEALAKIDEINDAIRQEFDSSDLDDSLSKI